MQKKLIQLLIDIFNINEEEAKNSSMNSISTWYSLSHIDLMMTIEEEFNIPKITPDEIVSMTNTESIKQILKNKGVGI